MTPRTRIIPVLTMLDGRLVKTRGFRDPAYVGDPINTVKIFNEYEVDELILLDIGASRAKREPDYALLEEIVGEAFMPIGYGGGVNSAPMARRIASLGIEKIAVNHAALASLDVIGDIAASLGSSSTLIAADVSKGGLYDWVRGRPVAGDPIDHIRAAVAAGAGEVLINDVDRDGMMGGMDLSLISEVATAIDVSVIACGGAGSLADLDAAAQAGADAVGAGSLFVYMGPHRAVMVNYPRADELQALRR